MCILGCGVTNIGHARLKNDYRKTINWILDMKRYYSSSERPLQISIPYAYFLILSVLGYVYLSLHGYRVAGHQYYPNAHPVKHI